MRPVPSHPGYFADEAGVIWSRARGVTRQLRSHTRKAHTGSLPYQNVMMGRGVCMLVHRAVCLAFHGEAPSSRHQVAHLDGNPLNNRPDNLAWKLPVANSADRLRHGTAGRKLTPEKVREIRAARAEGMILKEIAQKFLISISMASTVCRGESWWRVS